MTTLTQPSLFKNQNSGPDRLDNAAAALMLITALAALIWMCYRANFGLDLSDEGLYLLGMENPERYKTSSSMAAFVLHPFYELFSGNIVLLRQVSLGLNFVLAFILAYSIYPVLTQQKAHTFFRTGLSAAFATIILMATPLIFTPSYNSLNKQALLITAIGLVWANKRLSGASLAGWLLIGAGGWLSFMAKPSTAALLAAAVLIYLLASRKAISVGMLIAASIAGLLTVISMFMIYGSIGEYRQNMELALEFGRLLGGGHNLAEVFRVDFVALNFPGYCFLMILVLITSLITACLCNRSNKTVNFCITLTVIIVVILSALGMITEAYRPLKIAIWLEGFNYALGPGRFLTFFLFGPIIGLAAGLIFVHRRAFLKNLGRASWSLGLLFLAMPHIYAFGTSNVNNYWNVGGNVGLFWVLGSLLIFMPAAKHLVSLRVIVPIVALAQALAVLVLAIGMLFPYRQTEPLYKMTSDFAITRTGTSLKVSSSIKNYFETFQTRAHQAGIKPGDPFIDLTGYSVTAIYILGVKPLGHAWNLGGYPGSVDYVRAGLDRETCENLAAAWILAEPYGIRPLPFETIDKYGLTLNEYSEMFRIKSLFSTGTNGETLQYLIKPSQKATSNGRDNCKRNQASSSGSQ